MGVFKIPLKFNAGGYKFGELPDNEPGECLELEYDNEYQLITYNAPLYESEVRVYTVPRELMPGGLTAVYDDGGTLDRVELADGERTRLFYIWFKNISKSERGVLKYVKEQAERVAKEIIAKKQTLARLFIEKFYDGEAVDIAVKTATAEEARAVIDHYNGELRTADNSGNYPVANRLELDRETLGVMLMCTLGHFRSMLFNKAAEAFEERLKKRVLDKIKKTEDFKFICEEYD
ncbi:MAG: hypothetical protein K2J77_02060 [Oscillospiraceae bacterium]|nr:hypothetical protein [Oscillospiraceae bacterium]